MSRYLLAIAVLSLIVLTAVLVFAPVEQAPPQKSKEKQRVYVPVADPPAPETRSPTDVQQPASLDDREMDLKTIKKIGLLSREERWIAEAMDAKFWTLKSGSIGTDQPLNAGPRSQIWENRNGVQLTWWSQNGRVVRAAAEFPDGATSASVTALAIYFVGTQFDIPIKLEDPKRGSNRVEQGNFFVRDGRRFFYRGQLRDDGEYLSGPKHFEIRTAPFEGQSRLEPPVDGFLPD